MDRSKHQQALLDPCSVFNGGPYPEIPKMKHEGGNIYSVFDELMPQQAKEHFLQQRAVVVWFHGLSGAGKTTIARHLEPLLLGHGYFAQVLDGDNLRAGLNQGLGFDAEARSENIRRMAEVAKLFVRSGIICLACSISPTEVIRQQTRAILANERLLEVHVSTELATCEQRDPKGLYAKARTGEIARFTGISDVYETPAHTDLKLQTSGSSIEETTNSAFQFLLPHIQLHT